MNKVVVAFDAADIMEVTHAHGGERPEYSLPVF
jgi:hypothetical protein